MEFGVAIGLAYLLICFWAIWYKFRQPIFIPFWLFRYLCSFGKKASMEALPKGMDGLDKWGFMDKRYQSWFEAVMQRGSVARLEFFCFNQQRVTAIDAELKRRGIKTEKD